MLNKYYSIGTSQVETQSTNMGGKQKNIYGWIIVESEIEP